VFTYLRLERVQILTCFKHRKKKTKNDFLIDIRFFFFIVIRFVVAHTVPTDFFEVRRKTLIDLFVTIFVVASVLLFL